MGYQSHKILDSARSLQATRYLNQFGHPHANVVARYQQIKANILAAANTEAVSITTKDKQLSVSAFRETDGKYWHARNP